MSPPLFYEKGGGGMFEIAIMSEIGMDVHKREIIEINCFCLEWKK